MTSTTNAHPSSFRDPAGFVFEHNGTIYRQINLAGQAEYDQATTSGLYEALAAKGLLIAHTEVKNLSRFGKDERRYKIIQPEPIPFVSYPYEWSFQQLKAAALLTLEVQKIALEHGMILKDASAYNVQFIGKRPVFIDTLSFAKYEPGSPWDGYKQFCEHFLAPLAVAHYTTFDILKSLETYLEGMPLELACALLPKRARLRSGLLSHLYLHKASKKRYENAGAKGADIPKRTVSAFALNGLIASLQSTIHKLRPPKQQTEWGDYYTFTNYSDAAFKEKQKVVRKLLKQISPGIQTAWDLGANNGEFSRLAAEMGAYTIAFDIDPIAVGRNFTHSDDHDTRLLPLVQDCTNPSASVGWMSRERDGLLQRGPADVVMALALIHHLAIGRNLPFTNLASLFAAAGKHVIVEFVPKADSKVQILLASRPDIFPDYDEAHFEAAMAEHFSLTEKVPIKGTKRTMYLFTHKKSAKA